MTSTNLKLHPQYKAASKIAKVLSKNGHEAFLAGGAVRDLVMGRVAKDLDIATSADPATVESLFVKTNPIGKAFGVIQVIEDGTPIEVTTFRHDGKYIDGRRPESVTFCSREEDAKRRDFTINGMYFDFKNETIIDDVGGKPDIADHRIRAIGEPSLRFKEDHLRILRAIRFASELGFSIESSTLQAMTALRSTITTVSAERIRQEFIKLVQGDHLLSGAEALVQSKILDVLIEDSLKEQTAVIAPSLSQKAIFEIFHSLEKIPKPFRYEGFLVLLSLSVSKDLSMAKEVATLLAHRHFSLSRKSMDHVSFGFLAITVFLNQKT